MSASTPKAIETGRYYPRGLLLGTYLLYLGLATTAGVPLFGQIDWLHEGERLGAAQVVLNGGLPFRDVYLVHGLFPEVIRPLLAFGLFGESLAADRIVGVLLAPLPYVAAVFYVWKLFSTSFWRLVALAGVALYPLLLLPRHIVVFLALGLLTAWVREGRRGQLICAGLLAGSGYVLSTIDQATFLLATAALFPFVAAVARYAVRSTRAAGGEVAAKSVPTDLWEISGPLLMGIAVGALPFLAYLLVTGTWEQFLLDLLRRSEADLFALIHIHKQESFPAMNPANAIWYAVPLFYAATVAIMLVRLWSKREEHWIALIPTLLFGIFSFVYALRQFTYWKLAVVSFPFIIGVVYLLSVATTRWNWDNDGTERGGRRAAWVLAGVTVVLMLMLLVQSLTRDWKPKQIAPRIVFPVIALGVLSATAWAVTRRPDGSPIKARLVAIGPLAALIVSVWFYTDTKPPVLSAQIRKPRLVLDTGRLASTMVEAGGRLSRDRPMYLDDNVVAYLKKRYAEGQPVVVLASGAGVYYFHAGVAPPNRFPHIEMAMAEGWAREVVEGLDRTSAEVLVSCRDREGTLTGWTMHPVLRDYIAEHYEDSGKRLRSAMLGESCPFSIWVNLRRGPGPAA